MKLLFLIIPFIFAAIVAYKINEKLYITHKERILLSLYEGLTVSLIGLILFYARFFSIWLNIVILLVALGLMLGRLWSDQMHHADEDLKIEAIKNTLIIFVIGYIPVLVFLTVFRYTPFYLQIPAAIGIALLIVFITFNTQEYTTALINRFGTWFQRADWHKYIFVWLSIFVFAVIWASFRIPMDSISQGLNLSNQSRFYDSIGLPYDTQNNFEQELLLEINVAEDVTISDYVYDQDYVYVLFNDGNINIYDIDSKGLSKQIMSNEPLRDLILYDGDIYVTSIQITSEGSNNDLYRINNTVLENIYTTSNVRGYFYEGELLHFYRLSDDDTLYEIYQINNGVISLTDTINIVSLDNKELTIISDSLFLSSISTTQLYNHSDLIYQVQDAMYFDRNTQTMYTGEVSVEDYETFYKSETYTDGGGLAVVESSLVGYYEYLPYASDGVVYYTNKPAEFFLSEGAHVLIQNEDSEINTVFLHSGKDNFFKWNDYRTVVIDYRIGDEGLEFIQLDKHSNRDIYSIYRLIEHDVDMALPFYSYFGLGTIYMILIAMIIPITNYKTSITILGGKQNLNIKKSAE